jgi:hypothetical protein
MLACIKGLIAYYSPAGVGIKSIFTGQNRQRNCFPSALNSCLTSLLNVTQRALSVTQRALSVT